MTAIVGAELQFDRFISEDPGNGIIAVLKSDASDANLLAWDPATGNVTHSAPANSSGTNTRIHQFDRPINTSSTVTVGDILAANGLSASGRHLTGKGAAGTAHEYISGIKDALANATATTFLRATLPNVGTSQYSGVSFIIFYSAQVYRASSIRNVTWETGIAHVTAAKFEESAPDTLNASISKASSQQGGGGSALTVALTVTTPDVDTVEVKISLDSAASGTVRRNFRFLALALLPEGTGALSTGLSLTVV